MSFTRGDQLRGVAILRGRCAIVGIGEFQDRKSLIHEATILVAAAVSPVHIQNQGLRNATPCLRLCRIGLDSMRQSQHAAQEWRWQRSFGLFPCDGRSLRIYTCLRYTVSFQSPCCPFATRDGTFEQFQPLPKFLNITSDFVFAHATLLADRGIRAERKTRA